jgi:alcohol dehydrogenase YqhD (iron-dependent ADH family)
MEYDFTFENPTRIHFGKKSLEKLPGELAAFGSRVLLVYGGGSIKKSGLYDSLQTVLRAAGKEVRELSGVPSNPTAAKVREGIALAKEQPPHLILAVGGGSVIDCAKTIAGGACIQGDFWEPFFLKRQEPERAIPIGVVLTMAGTGSEMNGEAVVTDEATKQKLGTHSDLYYPVFSILNPELTYTVPRDQMVSGICDIFSHILEVYLSPSDEDNLSDDLAEAMMRSLLRAARAAVENPRDYAARSNIMWTATLALNGLLAPSKRQDWMAHQIEHQIGAYTNCPHGQGLAAISAGYYRVILPHAAERFARFGAEVWRLPAEGKTPEQQGAAAIDALEAFFRELGAATSLGELGMDETAPLGEIAQSIRRFRGGYHKLTEEELTQLLRRAL